MLRATHFPTSGQKAASVKAHHLLSPPHRQVLEMEIVLALENGISERTQDGIRPRIIGIPWGTIPIPP